MNSNVKSIGLVKWLSGDKKVRPILEVFTAYSKHNSKNLLGQEVALEPTCIRPLRRLQTIIHRLRNSTLLLTQFRLLANPKALQQ
jgi:hypothetical protein